MIDDGWWDWRVEIWVGESIQSFDDVSLPSKRAIAKPFVLEWADGLLGRLTGACEI